MTVRLPIETILGFAVIFLPGLYKGLKPFGMVDGVREKLSLQAYTAAFGIAYATFAGFFGIVGRIQLHAGAIGDHRHAPSAAWVGKIGTGIAEYLKIVVIA